MDFTLSEDQQAIADLAGRILQEQMTPERVRAVEQHQDWFAAEVWRELAKAQLLGAALSEDVGGAGLGVLEACLVLEHVGRTVAPLPYLSTIMLGGLAIDRFGSDAQRRRFLPGVVDGRTILSAALLEVGHFTAPPLPAVSARRVSGAWHLTGEKYFVPAAHLAAAVLVPARVDDRAVGIFLLDPHLPGVRLERLETTSGEPQFTVHMRDVALQDAEVLGDPGGGAQMVIWIEQRALAGLCAMQAGVCEAALRRTATYVSEREQFGTKLATFQAVAHRAADAYIDTEAVVLTARQAAWRLAAGLPADEALAAAKFWAAEGGQRVAHAAQHLHGGIGVDTDYPLYRYFRWSKQLELTLGGAAVHLDRLGLLLAARPADTTI